MFGAKGVGFLQVGRDAVVLVNNDFGLLVAKVNTATGMCVYCPAFEVTPLQRRHGNIGALYIRAGETNMLSCLVHFVFTSSDVPRFCT